MARPVSLWSPVTITGRMPAAAALARPPRCLVARRIDLRRPGRASARLPASCVEAGCRVQSSRPPPPRTRARAAPAPPSRRPPRAARVAASTAAAVGAHSAQHRLGRALDEHPARRAVRRAAWPSSWRRSRRASPRRAVPAVRSASRSMPALAREHEQRGFGGIAQRASSVRARLSGGSSCASLHSTAASSSARSAGVVGAVGSRAGLGQLCLRARSRRR